MNQKARVLSALTKGPVCSLTKWHPPIRRLAARIHDLKTDGWDITAADCPLHAHQSRTVAYVLQSASLVLTPVGALTAKPSNGWRF